MASTTLLTFLIERFTDYDSTLDTGEGSNLREKVIDPLLVRLGDSPLDVDLQQLVLDTLGQEDADLDTSEGTAIRDVLVKFLVPAFDPLKREIEFLRVANSFNNAVSLTKDELNDHLGNFFLSMNEGVKVSATFRVWYRSPRTVTVTPLTRFSIGEYNYFPTVVQTISSATMRFQRVDGLYYFDASVEAENSGSVYNVTLNQSIGEFDLLGADKVTVQASLITSGLDAESNTEAAARAESSISQRNLLTVPGAKLILKDNFPAIDFDNIQVVGFGDTEMQRDVVKGAATISEIPGGVLGYSPPDILAGNQIHIGGKTDIHVFMPSTAQSLTILNPGTIGKFIISSETGYTLPGGSGTPFLHDDTMAFHLVLAGYTGLTLNRSGYYLRMGINEFAVKNFDPVGQWIEIHTASATDPVAAVGAVVSDVDVTNTAVLSATGVVEFVVGRSSLGYEIYYKDFETDDLSPTHVRGPIFDAPLWNVIAETAGVPVFESGNAVAPLPGSPTLAPLTDTLGANILKSALVYIENPLAGGGQQLGPNQGIENVSTPIHWAQDVLQLDPTTEEVLSTIPYGAPVRAVAMEDFEANEAGVVRLYFLTKASAAVFRDRLGATRLMSGTNKLYATPLVAYSRASAPWAPPIGTSFPPGHATLGAPYTNTWLYSDGLSNVLKIEYESPATVWNVVNLNTAHTVGTTIPRMPQAGDRVVYWQNGDTTLGTQTDAVVCVIQAINLTLGEVTVHWPAGSFPPDTTTGTWSQNRSGYAICQGALQSASTLDANSGLYYHDFSFEAALANTTTVSRGTELTWLDEANTETDYVITSAVASPARVQGWKLVPHNNVMSHSTFERPHLRCTWQVNDSVFLVDPPGYGTSVGSPKIRLDYKTMESLVPVQTFVNGAERIVSEEVLVRTMFLAGIAGTISFKGGDTAASMLTALETYIAELDVSTGLEVSDLVNQLIRKGANYVKLPIELIIISEEAGRVFKATLVNDVSAFSRLHQTESFRSLLTVVDLDA